MDPKKLPLTKKEKITKYLSGPDIIFARAPGRINLIGEHTDYNKGLVLPAAIDKYMYFGCVENDGNFINAHALDKNQSVRLDVNNLKRSKYLWANYFIGILLEFEKRNIELKGFDCAFTSDVPIGAGVSSSAALDSAFLFGLKELFGATMDKRTLVDMAHSSNNNFLGIKSGILDQFSSIFGKEKKVVFMDCATFEYDYIDVPPSQYSWLLINSCVKHTHLTSGYNDRTEECATALSNIKAKYLETEYISQIRVAEQLKGVQFDSQTISDRATYIIEENERVRQFVKALTTGDFYRCGSLLYDSHEGLSKKYEVSCAELDFLVDILRDDEAVLGSRMMGGGFGGCTINLIDTGQKERIKTFVTGRYEDEFGIKPEFYDVNIADGAEVIFGK